MSQTHTVVVRFPEGIVPRYSAATEFQGGQVVAVDFDGNRLQIAYELEEALDDLRTSCIALGLEDELSQELHNASAVMANARSIP